MTTSLLLPFAVLLGLAGWLAPNHYPPWLSFHSEALMAAAMLLALPTAFPRGGTTRAPLSPLLRAALLLMALPLVHGLLGMIDFAGDAWMGFAYLLGLALSIWFGQRLAALHGAERVFEVLAGIFIAAAILSMAVAFDQWLSLRILGIFAADLPPNGRPFANLAQPNHLATLLFVGLVGGLYLFERRRIGPGVMALLCVFLTFGLVMTSSRTAWLAMSLLVLGLWALQPRAALRLPRRAIVAVGLVFVAWLFAWPGLNDALLLSSGRATSNLTESSSRVLLWSTAVDGIRHAPWIGYGWNQARAAQMDVLLAHPASGRLVGSTHNLLLDLWIWCGIPLGSAIIGGLMVWGWRRLADARTAAPVLVLIALAGIFAHAMVELPLSFSYFLLPAGLLMGLIDPVGHGAQPQRGVHRGWFGGLGAAACALLGFITVDYFKIEDSMRTLRFETARIGTDRIESKAPELLLLTQWAAYLQWARVEPHAGMSPAELQEFERVVRRFPYAGMQMNLARAQGLNGQSAAAAMTLRRLCTLHTTQRCSEQLAQWREWVEGAHPQLAAIALPARP